MGIKSKPVDPQRAAAAARGQLGNPGSTSGQKHSFYYEPERQRQQRERDDETSSNSSVDSTSPSTANTTEARALPPTFQTEADGVRGRNEDSSDDEALAAARERTRRFLYPDSERNYVPQPYHNARLEVYERRRMELETEERLRRIAKEEAEREDAPAAPEPAPPTAIPVDTSHAAHSLPQPQHSDATKKEETPAPPLITKEEFDGLVRAMHAAQPSGYSIPTTLLHSKPPSHGTRPPQVRTFAQLQDNALQQLYADWQREEDDEDGSSEKDGQRRAFVATQHTSAAFTLAALEAARQDARRRESSAMFGGISDRPFTLEELAAAETQRRNARRGGHESSGAQWMDAGGIASRAQMELHTFFQCVHWVERIVRDPRFLESVGSFLFRHHQVFLRHYNASAGCVMEDAFFNGEHSHDELRVYEEFGTKLSELINKVLQEHISGFDEAEFVETLFDTPVGADINSQPVPKHGVRGPQNVLTYPAWRLILAMSSFPSFFAYMMDYIQEEYNLEEATGTEIAVGGSRGVRALVSSMYRNQDAEATLDEEQARLTGTAPDALANAAVTEEAPISSLPPPPSTTTTAVVPEVPSAWSPDMTPPPLPTPGTTIELTPVVVPKRGKTKPNSLPCSADGMTKKPTEATRNRLGSPNDRVTSAGSNPPPPPSTSGTGELPTLKKAKGRLSAPTTGTTTTSSTVTPRVTPATTRTPSNARKGVKPKLKRPGK